MSEIYWITVLGKLYDVLIAIRSASLFALLAGFLFYIGTVANGITIYAVRTLKALKYCIAIAIISVIGSVFVPTKKELFAIYGIGGVVDYVQDNDKAKQLPDKAVDALSKWLESYGENKED